MNRPLALVLALAAVAVAVRSFAQDEKKPPTREEKVRGDKDRVGAMDSWIYADLPRGIEEAKKTGKPLLVVFRCIPCEACAQIDEDVVTRDPKVAKLLDQYVCVRIPQMNGVDISIFQFDYDQSWAAFLMNADMTIYGRYGTRSSHKDSADDVSLEGFAAALAGALELHAKFPEVRDSLKSKRGGKREVAAPEDFPSFGGKFKPSLDYSPETKVVPSCIHCHQVTEASRRFHRDAGKTIPEELLFPYPNPSVLGLVMDAKARARIASVVSGSSAEKDGFLAGDEIVQFGDVPMLSIADIQWVLHWAPTRGFGSVTVLRDGKSVALKLTFPSDWRIKSDVSWRASSWDLRRMTTGGMLLEGVAQEERTKLGIADGTMALRAKHVGQHGEHAAAKNAGFVKGDVIVAIDGISGITAGRMKIATESGLMTWLVNAKKPGEKVKVTVQREGKPSEMTLPIQ